MQARIYDVVISLLVYNQLEVTKQCIDSLFKTATSNFLLVISDNASKEETAGYLRALAEKRANVVYVRNTENLGFIVAHNNIYAKYANLAEHFCVLNNDLVFHMVGWDSSFIAELESSEKLAQVGPRQAHGYINNRGIGVPRPDRRQAPEYIGGSCFVAKVAAIGAKLFEAKYMKFAFSEDADLSFRLRASGYEIKEILGVTVEHKHHVSFKNEKLDFDFKEMEMANQRFLIDRWRNYIKTRTFKPLEILLIRTGALGDAFMAEPIARELANKYPGSNIYFQTRCPEWFSPCDYIKECGPGLKARRAYDIVIDLDMSYEKSPKMHVVDAYAQTAAVILDDDKRVPKYCEMPASIKSVKTAVINSEGSWASRQWPLDRIKAFALYLQGQGYQIKEVGRTQSFYVGVGENLIGKLSLYETVKVIAGADLYFGMDGGLAHFAQSVGVKSVLIFGCTNPAYRIHDKAKTKAIWLEGLPCAGCHHEGGPRTFTACKFGTHECLAGITVEHAIKEFEEFAA